ncbi:hypothetical protein [Mycobacterium shinjukuense]|uniref:Uncharacterized protein n=1 Tax=Mycobacterium shinjukuense TaxID=398694 RepID=A0A7I7MQU3_9MYCO|nr:hypothetical protein [Mycobacterium shinjukuense]BBX74615.1 hypothetical protein MSHI_25210 [Mycobacterium shinjukuense]
MALHNEIEFEKRSSPSTWPANGWLYSPNDAGYDRERALFPDDVYGWLTDTQPEQLEQVVKPGSRRYRQAAGPITWTGSSKSSIYRWATAGAMLEICGSAGEGAYLPEWSMKVPS